MGKRNNKVMRLIDSVKDICDNYDYFIIDLWGVLHDGVTPYPHAVEALEYIKSRNKKIALLSNAPRRSFKAKEVLENLGFKQEYYDILLTSGEATQEYAAKNYPENSKYYYIGPQKDRDILEATTFKEVLEPKEADFAIITGFEGFGSVFEEKKIFADKALEAGLTLLCANPDRLVIRQTGEEQICAGLIGEYYAEKGGEVIFFGKPYDYVYKKLIEEFNITDASKVLCIGDSFHTDMKGANNIGADSLLSAIGIHSRELIKDNVIDFEEAKKAAEKEGSNATYIIREFC